MYNKEFETIFNYSKNKADEIEILLSAGNSFSVKINEQNVESFDYSDSKGIGVRVIKDGKLGYAYTEKFDEETLCRIVDEAIENAKFTETDDLVEMGNYPDNEVIINNFDPKLDEVDVADKIQMAKDFERLAKEEDERVFNVPYAVFGNSTGYVRIANSKGLDKDEKSNIAYGYVAALSQEGEDKRMGMDYFITRDLSTVDPKEIVKTAVKKSTDLLNGKPIETGEYAVVFNNDMMATMLSTFSGIFNAKAVQEGRSLLVDKIGESIANEKITIVDDAIHPEGNNSRRFDSEGYPSQRTILVENGVLKSYLHNTITALKDGVKSTGNGSRGYKGTLGISPSNFLLVPGNEKESELFTKHDKIIEILSLQGMHSGANPISGDFSLGAQGFLWENGKRQHSLKPFTVSGNYLKMLNNVESIADNFRFNMSSIGAPSVLISSLSISG